MPIIILLFCFSYWAFSVEPWVGAGPATGFVCKDLDLALKDGGTVAVRIHWPAIGSGPWPVVIFSHGLAGSRSTYGFLAEGWSSHGYVVIQPNHPGSDTEILKGRKPTEWSSILLNAAIDPGLRAARPKLISRIIDALPALEDAVPALAGQVNRGHIGVAGHSYGGGTAMCIAGQRIRLPGQDGQSVPMDLSDPRPTAIIALSPPGPEAIAQPSDWTSIVRPLLVMTGSKDRQVSFLNPMDLDHAGAWRRKVFDFSPADGTKCLAWFEGATHTTFADGAGGKLTGEGRPDPAQVRAVVAVTLAWWDAYLRSDIHAQAWMSDPDAAATLGPWARFEHR